MGSFLVDTHLWIWLQENDQARIKAKHLPWINATQKERRLYISAISIWEIGNLVAKNKLQLEQDVSTWVAEAFTDDGFQLLGLSPDILIESTRLPGKPHGDPGDRMLIATARHHGLTLLTYDDLILKYAKEGHLKARKL